MLKAVTGFVAPRAGRIRFAGQDITGTRADRLVPLGLAYVPQGRIVFPQMSVEENLDLGAFTLSSAAGKREVLQRVLALFPAWRSAARSWRGRCPGASSRCWPSPAG